jgi:hypothetical protein
MDSYFIRYPDGTIRNELKCVCFWSGYFSTVLQNGALVQYLSTLFERIQTENPQQKFLFFMPQSDGDILLAEYRYILSETYLADLRDSGVKIVIGSVAQRFSSGFRDADVDYFFLPQDDHIFQYGLRSHFILENLPKWSDRISQIFWRGSGSRRTLLNESGFKRREVVSSLINNPAADVRFVNNWIYPDDHIPDTWISPLITYWHFCNYKMILIVDGNGISSAHTWCFGIGAVPMLVTNNTFWFSDLLVPFENYIPIRYDLSDLEEKVTWVLDHDEEAREIAKRASEFAYRVFTPEYQSDYLYRRFRDILHR